MQDQTTWEWFLFWLENNPAALYVRQATWLYPIVEIVHIAGFALLVGAAVLHDLRLLGFLRRLPARDVTRHLTFWAKMSLLAVIPSGLTLFMVDASSLASNPAFQIKLILILAAGINAAIFHCYIFKTVDEWNQCTRPPLAARVAGLTSIAIWFSVIACGRLIAYT